MASNAVFENGSRLPEPCAPQAGFWCSRHERRPYVRLIVLGKRAASFKSGSDLDAEATPEVYRCCLMRTLDLNGALRPAHSRSHQIRDRYPGASDISSPPCLPRLLPAGAIAG